MSKEIYKYGFKNKKIIFSHYLLEDTSKLYPFEKTNLKEDINLWIKYNNEDIEKFITNALSPAKNIKVFILDSNKQEALAIADGEDFSLALGKKGQNVKLAARLTKCKIDVKTREQVQEEGINIYKY